MSSADSAPLVESQGVATINVNLLNLDVATFNFGCRNAVKEKDKLTQVELRMNQLLHKNSILCLQEADGIIDTLVIVATRHKWQHCACFEGIVAFWDPTKWELVRHSEERSWPQESGGKADWRRLVVCIFAFQGKW